jgi:hypothetical protein
MIDYQEETITIFNLETEEELTEKIERWEVWFCTAYAGTFRSYAAAKANASNESIMPLPVAIAKTIFEVIVR